MRTSGRAPFRLTEEIASLDSPFSVVILACLVAAMSYLAAALGGALVLRPQMIWPLWPGCGLLVAVLLSTPRKTWPALLTAGLAGFVLYDVRAGLSIRATSWLILGDTLEILIAAWGVTFFFGGAPRLTSIKSLAKYSFFAVGLAPISAASVGAVAVQGNYWVKWRISFLTEALALLTVTPAILSWVDPARSGSQKSRAYYLEEAVLIVGLVVLGYITFVASGGSNRPALFYSLVPFLLWSALRFGIKGTTTSILVVAFLSIWGAVHGRGPFTAQGPLNNVFSLQLFLLFAATSFMVLAALSEERAQAGQALRESERRFRLMADTAPALIWTSGIDKLVTYINKPWLDFTGRSIEQERGNGWAEGVHREDLQRCLDTYTQCFERREKFGIEYRLRRRDGEYRWILNIGVPRFNQDHSFAGYIGIGVDVTDRKCAEQELDLAHERLRAAMKSGKAVGRDWDIKSGRDSWFGDLQTQFGISSDTYVGRVEDFHRRIHPEDRERVATALRNAMQGHTAYAEEFRILWPDGSVRWISSEGTFHYTVNGEPERMLGMAVDVTERKRTQEALRRSEEKFVKAFRASPVAIALTSMRDHRYIEVNETFERLTGHRRDEVIGRTPFDLEFWVDPFQRDEFIQRLRSEGSLRDLEVRYRAKSGSIRIGLASAELIEIEGEPSMLGVISDITDRKAAEEALSGLSRKLIEAQEQERTRIARELHDDVAQRLALLTIELQHLQRNPPNSAVETSGRVDQVRKQVIEISTDVQALSHELHSSKLEYLGIVAAMRSFCKEFVEQQKAEVDFRSHDLPAPLPADVSLCLFRVLQEALHNAAKYSGVGHFEVRLWGSPGEIHLTVSDLGVGFDLQEAMKGRGLGLTSMTERLHLVNGEIAIDSAPKRGTTIHARVPLVRENNSAQAAS